MYHVKKDQNDEIVSRHFTVRYQGWRQPNKQSGEKAKDESEISHCFVNYLNSLNHFNYLNTSNHSNYLNSMNRLNYLNFLNPPII